MTSAQHEASSVVETRLSHVQIEEAWLEYKFINCDQPTCFPNSVHLQLTNRQHEDDPEAIFIHRHSFFAVDVRNHNLSTNG
jgi:hypothetical protein